MSPLSKNILLSLLLIFTVFPLPSPALPTPLPQAGSSIANAYTGAGGHASGGSVGTASSKSSTGAGGLLSNLKLIDAFSNNAGAAGKASSGPVLSPGAGIANITSDGSSPDANTGTSNVIGNAYSGVGGVADGGDVKEFDSAPISLFSGNAGKGGSANSGGASSAGGLLGGGLPLPIPGPSAARKTRLSRMIRVRRTFAASSDLGDSVVDN